MGSNNLIVGDAKTDEPLQTIAAPFSETPYIQYPHGIRCRSIDRVMVTNTVRPADLKDPGETVTVIEASTGKVLSTHKVSSRAWRSCFCPDRSILWRISVI
jgi:hypothetical protein